MLSTKQARVLTHLAARSISGAPSVLSIVRALETDRGHAAGYLRLARLAKRGMVTILPLHEGARRVLITAAGLREVAGVYPYAADAGRVTT